MAEFLKITDRGIIPIEEPIKLVPNKDPILRKVMPYFDFNVRYDAVQIANKLIDVMQLSKGLGLAAPQIGIEANVFIMGDSNNVIACFNPKIIESSKETIKLEEGCLSFPHLYLKIERPKSVIMEFQSYDGKQKQTTFDGMSARVVQHEVDHLNGKLFVDHVGETSLMMAKKKAVKLLRGVSK